MSDYPEDAATPRGGGWSAGQRPWIRQRMMEGHRVVCPFCGTADAIQSHGDQPADYGRMEVYCDNPRCDARKIVILGTSGEFAGPRADVRALKAVDAYADKAEPVPERESTDWEDTFSTEERWEQNLERLRDAAINEGDSATRRRLFKGRFRMNVD